MKKLDNRVTVPVVDRFGYLVEEQEYRNTPLAELYPDEKVILLQWTAEHDNSRPSVEELSMPVEYEGQNYIGCWAWGSAVKRGITIGMTHDFPHIDGPVKLVEDGQRIGRWLMSQGIFGGLRPISWRLASKSPAL